MTEQTRETGLKVGGIAKTENDDPNQDRNKFKKAEMSIFNGSDSDS